MSQLALGRAGRAPSCPYANAMTPRRGKAPRLSCHDHLARGRRDCLISSKIDQCLCPTTCCPALERLRNSYEDTANKMAEVHAATLNVSVHAERFLRNACRCARWRSDARNLHDALTSQGLYIATALSAGDGEAWRLFFDRYSTTITVACQQSRLTSEEAERVRSNLVTVHG